MDRDRRRRLAGKTVLIAHEMIHHDRAGETGSRVEALDRIVAIDARSGAVAVTKAGLHLRCSVSRLYRAPAEGDGLEPQGLVHPGYVGVEPLSRDFFSGTQTRPLLVKWLDRRSVLEVLRQRGR